MRDRYQHIMGWEMTAQCSGALLLYWRADWRLRCGADQLIYSSFPVVGFLSEANWNVPVFSLTAFSPLNLQVTIHLPVFQSGTFFLNGRKIAQVWTCLCGVFTICAEVWSRVLSCVWKLLKCFSVPKLFFIKRCSNLELLWT